ncbi:GspE/PulE family protein [Patescibacteria group bacterium]|nr:GspE/PulE family protein [Patescibacteria group bacterium]
MTEKIVGEINISASFLSITQRIKNVPVFKEEIEKNLEKSTSELLDIILGGAINLDGSDIHIEPREEDVKIRLRLDGILQDIVSFEKKIYENAISRLKLLSGIKLNIDDRPQDGRFTITLGRADSKRGAPIEVRVSTLPTEFGESIVLRILNPKSLISIAELGFRPDLLEVFKKEIKKPNGMIIVTGPTGSGKTTTLYGFLKEIQNPEVKIITIEDPIEYHLASISQTQVNPSKGYDFANGLRAIVRQDPDVILVGEVRDLETASIALQAALTGHLVLSTLHTNDAAGTIARLQSLGEKPINIAPAINMIIAQRLVRKVCKSCFKVASPEPKILAQLKKDLKDIPPEIYISSLDQGLKIPKAVGCRDCNFTGYRGRTGIYEALLVDDEMENFILDAPSISALKEKAIKKGMLPMKQDGLLKVLQGMTTLEEIERVAGE